MHIISVSNETRRNKMATAVNQNSKTSPAMHVLYLLLISATIVSLGALMGFIGGATEGYSGITRPTLTPPDITFSIVWPILYFMIGASFYLTLITTPSNKEEKTIRIVSIVIFFVQLAFNFTWTPIFFKARLYFFAFVWLAVLDAMVTALIILNFKINKWSAILLIPYLAWILFATYLNVMIAVYN